MRARTETAQKTGPATRERRVGGALGRAGARVRGSVRRSVPTSVPSRRSQTPVPRHRGEQRHNRVYAKGNPYFHDLHGLHKYNDAGPVCRRTGEIQQPRRGLRRGSPKLGKLGQATWRTSQGRNSRATIRQSRQVDGRTAVDLSLGALRRWRASSAWQAHRPTIRNGHEDRRARKAAKSEGQARGLPSTQQLQIKQLMLMA